MTEAPRYIRVRALAKINLTLRVLGVRPDGYHELRTTFQSLALHDTLTFTPTDDPLSIACDDARVPVGSGNLVWTAAEQLWAALGRPGTPSGIRIEIKKGIPMQAGLGGGSSDAAAALRGLLAFWRGTLTDKQLRAVARTLGADVPYFLEGGTVLGVDRGDVLYPLMDRPASWVVLVVPEFGVSTKDAYEWWDQASLHLDEDRVHLETTNDLEPPVTARHPEIARLIKQIEELGAANAAMSGSGSALFGLFKTEAAANTAANAVASPGVTTIVTQTVSRRAYQTATRPK